MHTVSNPHCNAHSFTFIQWIWKLRNSQTCVSEFHKSNDVFTAIIIMSAVTAIFFCLTYDWLPQLPQFCSGASVSPFRQACSFIKNLQAEPPSVRHSHLPTLGNRNPRSYCIDIWTATVLGLTMRLHVVPQLGLNAGHPATGPTEVSQLASTETNATGTDCDIRPTDLTQEKVLLWAVVVAVMNIRCL